MKRKVILLLCVALLVAIPALVAQCFNTEEIITGNWSLSGTQLNNIGTSEEHLYSYGSNDRWYYAPGVFNKNSMECTNVQVFGNTLTADYVGYGLDITITIEFLDENTAKFTLEGTSDSFGQYRIDATATRKN